MIGIKDMTMASRCAWIGAVALIVLVACASQVEALTVTAKAFNKDTASAAVGADVSYSATVTDLPPGKTEDDVTWAWDFGDDQSSSSQNPTHAFTGEAVGIRTVKVTASISGDCGGTAEDTCTVKVVERLIIDTVESRPSNKIAFNSKCEVKGHVLPTTVSEFDAGLDWEMNKIAYADCKLHQATGNLQWSANWPELNSRWAESGEALVVSLDYKTDQDGDLDSALGAGSIDAHKASFSCQKYFERLGTQNPDNHTPHWPNWYYYWKQSTTAYYESVEWQNGEALGESYFKNNDWHAWAEKAYLTGWTDKEGIDCFALTCRHEWQHKTDMETLWGAHTDRNAADDQDEGVGDYLKDSSEGTFDNAYQYDKTLTRTFPASGMRDDDHHAENRREGWTASTANGDDWGYPGKQW